MQAAPHHSFLKGYPVQHETLVPSSDSKADHPLQQDSPACGADSHAYHPLQHDTPAPGADSKAGSHVIHCSRTALQSGETAGQAAMSCTAA